MCFVVSVVFRLNEQPINACRVRCFRLNEHPLMQLHGFRAAVFETRNLRAAPLSNLATTAPCVRMAHE